MSAGGDSSQQKLWTPSNIITITRIVLVPVFVAALLAPWPEWFGDSAFVLGEWKSFVAAGIFVLISCTDWLDGYLARSRNEVTDFGKFMDPLADKILVAAALISLVDLHQLPTWVVLVILAREFIVSGVRMMAASKGVVIAASMLGKFKTVFQMIAIVLFTIKDSHMIGNFSDALSDGLWVVSWIVMLIAIALTIASLIDYLYKARDVIGLGSNDQAAEHGELTEEAHDTAARIVKSYTEAGATCATAESLTGGLIGAAITDVAGSSAVYKGGVVSYTNEVKHSALGVPDEVLASDGAVSEKTALAMADGARAKLGADVAVSVTGIAGPGGEEPGKPVGTVWIGLSTPEGTTAEHHVFEGDREEVRSSTVERALTLLANALGQPKEDTPR
ncbi:MAG: CDP-diacylglycerol--glycerol-3-phosphate 3-phosphatidyltransferase [Eggerthellaceae bacterium]|nr:CDP-diacylglycerol--glycerol-3-phosphate 3-phosphatidyltransferase [Eggerthellaceae bacterium]